jgi:hypothetical protein
MIVTRDMTFITRIVRRLARPLALVGAFSSLGCAARARTIVAAPTFVYPVSLSQAIITPSGGCYIPREAELLGHFRYSWKHWTMLWGLLSLTADKDITPILQAEIARRDGNGIVNLTMEASFGSTYYFTSLLPVVPADLTLTLEGDVVHIPSVPVESDMQHLCRIAPPPSLPSHEPPSTPTIIPPDPRADWSERYKKMVAGTEEQARDARAKGITGNQPGEEHPEPSGSETR